ncbi:unnamed protein product, partial [Allacma fusca]
VIGKGWDYLQFSELMKDPEDLVTQSSSMFTFKSRDQHLNILKKPLRRLPYHILLKRQNSDKKMNFRVISSLLILLCLFQWSQAMLSSSSRKSIKICLKNCGQCQRVYGDYFEGRRCADHCIATKGRSIPDCNDVNSIGGFLSKLE